jgi:hypothetical protein
MPVQIRRTPVADRVPTGLRPGQLAVGMADSPPKLYVGVPTTIDQTGVVWINQNILSSDQMTIMGTATGHEAPPGQVGEMVTLRGTLTTITTPILSGTAGILNGQLDLTPGDWQITGSVLVTHVAGGSTTMFTAGATTYIEDGVLYQHATLTNADYYSAWVGTISDTQSLTIPLPGLRWLTDQATTVRAGYFWNRSGSGTCTCRLRAQALRVR